jgi:hypothetical protein
MISCSEMFSGVGCPHPTPSSPESCQARTPDSTIAPTCGTPKLVWGWHPTFHCGVRRPCLTPGRDHPAIRSRKTAPWLAIVLIFLFATSGVEAQNRIDTVKSLAGIEIQTSVDRAEVYVGDLITYQLTITHDSTIEPVPPPLGANLGAFDVKDYETDIRSKLPDGRLQSTNKFVLSTFTTGDYIIPPIPVMFTMPDSSKKVVLSESVPIKVKSLLAEGADTADIHPLKAQYEFKRDMTLYYIWGGVILLVLALAGTLIWLRIRRKKGLAMPVDLRPAWEIAFERLALLKQKNYLADGEGKQYYVVLTEIARAYLGRMYRINVLDMTTEEFLFHFKEQHLPNDLYENMGRFLQHADLVKFAKLMPDRERAETDFDFVHKLIEQVRIDYLRRQAMVVDAHQQQTKRDDIPVAGGVAP